MLVDTGTPNLGLIEGFYGRQWSWDERTAMAAFLAATGYAFYLYAPKGDEHLRHKWTETWPTAVTGQLEKLRNECRTQGLKWGVGLSPFELPLDYSANARGNLLRKLNELAVLQPDILCLLFDDMRGLDKNLASTQAAIVADVLDTGLFPQLIMCPSYYSRDSVLPELFGEMPVNYWDDLGRLLAKEVDIFWTGPRVISAEYPKQDLIDITERFQRAPVLWDNYPVNDGATTSQYLHLAAFRNRSPQLASLTKGHAVNPMNQPALSRIPLLSLPQVYELGDAYDPGKAFDQACETVCTADVAKLLQEDATAFQTKGLANFNADQTQALLNRYQGHSDPVCKEVVAWLNNEYQFDPSCLTG